jgi:hypothetical protein
MDTTDQYYLLIAWSRLLEELTGSQLFKKFPAILSNPKVHYHIDMCCHLSLTNIGVLCFADHAS